MKIILASESFKPNISGVAVATEILANNLINAGHEVFVFCPGDKDETFTDKNFTTYKVLRFKSIKNPFRKGFRITAVSRREIEEKVKTISPDIIHLQDVATIGITLRNIGNSLKIPVVITNHFSLEFALSYVKFKPLLPLSRYLLIKYLVNFHNKCDLVVTPTETIAKQIRSWGVKTPVIAVSNGIFYDRFAKRLSKKTIDDFKLKSHLPENPIVLYTGRIDYDKSVDVIVKAIPMVAEKINAHFVLAGTGDLVPEMEKLAEELGVTKYITFLGRLDNQSTDFSALYQSASVFTIASTIETQSLVTLEAMSAGLPVVAVDFNALPELVRNNINGFLFKPADSKTLAKHIVQILKNQNLAENFGKSSMKIAAEHEMSKTFQKILAVYKEVIKYKKGQDGIKIDKLEFEKIIAK
jgi:glycosyltransferase involved in cell wall biosynthesis